MANTKKILLSLPNGIHDELEKYAKIRGLGVATLIRAVSIPEWLEIQRKTAK